MKQLSQPQQQQLESQQQQRQLKETNNDNAEDTRYEVPTEQSIQQVKNVNDAGAIIAASATIYQEVIFGNSSTNEVFTVQSEEPSLETRLKYV